MQRTIFNAVFVALLLLVAVVGIAWAMPDHHVELSGTWCRGETVHWTAKSWSMTGDGGLNPSIKVEYQTYFPTSGLLMAGAGQFTDANGRQFSGEIAIDPTVARVSLRSTVLAKWGNGTNGGQVNTADVYPVDCVPAHTPTATRTPKETGEPPTLTPTATGTTTSSPTTTATNTPTPSSTRTPTTIATTTPTRTSAATTTPTLTNTPTATATPTITSTATPTETSTPTSCGPGVDPCEPTSDDNSHEPDGAKHLFLPLVLK